MVLLSKKLNVRTFVFFQLFAVSKESWNIGSKLLSIGRIRQPSFLWRCSQIQCHLHLPERVRSRSLFRPPDPELRQLLHQHHVLARLHPLSRKVAANIRTQRGRGRVNRVCWCSRFSSQANLSGSLCTRHNRSSGKNASCSWESGHL